MTCPACGADALLSRDVFTGRVGVAQCGACSAVLEAAGWQARVCRHCGRAYGESMHDPCLGQLPGVLMACCGHGDPEQAYRVYADGRTEGRAH